MSGDGTVSGSINPESAETSGNDFTAVNIHLDTAALIDEIKPDYMARSAFVDGVVWMFYGHLDHRENNRLSVSEHRAVHRLKRVGIEHQTIAYAFDLPANYIRHIGSEPGKGEPVPLDERDGGVEE